MQFAAALVIAIGAFIGVYAGAVYAAQRLFDQLKEERHLAEDRLDAEAQRLQTQLDAEAKRLDKQLAHDRWMREVEELRRLVDDAAKAGLSAANAVGDFRGPVRHMQANQGIPGPLYIPAHEHAKSNTAGMQGFVERLELRLGRQHAVPLAYSAWQLKIDHTLEAIEARPPTKETLKEGSGLLKESADLYLRFMSEAREYVALSPPQD